jgi:hypothetical protein
MSASPVSYCMNPIHGLMTQETMQCVHKRFMCPPSLHREQFLHLFCLNSFLSIQFCKLVFEKKHVNSLHFAEKTVNWVITTLSITSSISCRRYEWSSFLPPNIEYCSNLSPSMLGTEWSYFKQNLPMANADEGLLDWRTVRSIQILTPETLVFFLQEL